MYKDVIHDLSNRRWGKQKEKREELGCAIKPNLGTNPNYIAINLNPKIQVDWKWKMEKRYSM